MRTTLYPALLALTLYASADARDLIENGGFEKGMSGFALLNNSGTSESRIDGKERRSGKKALFWKKNGGAPFDVLRTDLGDLDDGATLRISAWLKREKVQSCILKVFFYDESGESLGQGRDVLQTSGHGKWKEFAIENEVPQGQKSATIFLLMVGPGELWVDDLSATDRRTS